MRNYGVVYGHHVEHILSDNVTNRALFGDDEEMFIQQRNRLGGLLLLKGRDNIVSSNEPYRLKLATYSHSTLLAQTLCPDFYHANTGFKHFIQEKNLPFRSLESFGVEEVEERHRLYFELAKHIWGDQSFPLAAEQGS